MTSNPPIEMVARGVDTAKAFEADLVIGVGVGSARKILGEAK